MSTVSNDFEFTVTEDGKYLGFIEDQGRKIKIFNLFEIRFFIISIGKMTAAGFLANCATVIICARKVDVCKSTADQVNKQYIKLAHAL